MTLVNFTKRLSTSRARVELSSLSRAHADLGMVEKTARHEKTARTILLESLSVCFIGLCFGVSAGFFYDLLLQIYDLLHALEHLSEIFGLSETFRNLFHALSDAIHVFLGLIPVLGTRIRL